MSQPNYQSPPIGVAIVQWNHAHYTRRLLEDFGENRNFRIAVCDNGSEPDAWQSLKSAVDSRPDLEITTGNERENWWLCLLRNENNSGFAKGVNAALASLMETDCEWFWVLNNDVRVSHETQTRVHLELEKKEHGIYGTSIVTGDSPDARPGALIFDKRTTRYRRAMKQELAQIVPGENAYFDGASFIVHRQLLDEVGLLSEATFLYFEEFDYAKRVAEHPAFRQEVLVDVAIAHEEAGSSADSRFSKRRMYHETWSTLSFYSRHYRGLYLPIIFLRTPARILSLCASGRCGLVSSVISATWDFIRRHNRDQRPVRVVETVRFR